MALFRLGPERAGRPESLRFTAISKGGAWGLSSVTLPRTLAKAWCASPDHLSSAPGKLPDRPHDPAIRPETALPIVRFMSAKPVGDNWLKSGGQLRRQFRFAGEDNPMFQIIDRSDEAVQILHIVHG